MLQRIVRQLLTFRGARLQAVPPGVVVLLVQSVSPIDALGPQRAEPLFPQSVVQHGQGVAGVVQLAASDDAEVVQRQQAHRHVSHEDVALHLHDALEQRPRQNIRGEAAAVD
ncbi:hypothetical protein EYF80_038113 [Liparis tanakae]|uniref:Uncharacterized protein n=1 Tax=Liparis tanakae TaxID=230148 RepID=A0A4Z2GER2_9TELE|nr:hypothetical protein EYF80_038113 [Liparis tanakae]